MIISKVPSHLLRLLQAQDANRVVLVSYKQRTTYISMSCFYKILFNHKSNTHPHTHTGSISLWHVALYSLISSPIYKPTLLSLFNLTTIESFSLCLCYFSFQYFLFTLSHLYILLSLSLSFFHAYTIWLEYYFIYLFLSFMISLSQLYILSLSLSLTFSVNNSSNRKMYQQRFAASTVSVERNELWRRLNKFFVFLSSVLRQIYSDSRVNI